MRPPGRNPVLSAPDEGLRHVSTGSWATPVMHVYAQSSHYAARATSRFWDRWPRWRPAGPASGGPWRLVMPISGAYLPGRRPTAAGQNRSLCLPGLSRRVKNDPVQRADRLRSDPRRDVPPTVTRRCLARRNRAERRAPSRASSARVSGGSTPAPLLLRGSPGRRKASLPPNSWPMARCCSSPSGLSQGLSKRERPSPPKAPSGCCRRPAERRAGSLLRQAGSARSPRRGSLSATWLQPLRFPVPAAPMRMPPAGRPARKPG